MIVLIEATSKLAAYPKTISRRSGNAISIATVRLSLLSSRNSLAAIAHIVEIPFR